MEIDYKHLHKYEVGEYAKLKMDCDAGLKGAYVTIMGPPQGADPYDPHFSVNDGRNAGNRLARYHHLEPVLGDEAYDEAELLREKNGAGESIVGLTEEQNREAIEAEARNASMIDDLPSLGMMGTANSIQEIAEAIEKLAYLNDQVPTDPMSDHLGEYHISPFECDNPMCYCHPRNYDDSYNSPVVMSNDDLVNQMLPLTDEEVAQIIRDDFERQYVRPEGTKGIKKDAGKPRFDLLPYSALKGAADIFTFGSDKYDVDEEGYPTNAVHLQNWRQGMRWGRVYAAMQRHLTAWFNGEDNDHESDRSHLDHALCCLMMLKEYSQSYLQGDDRPTSYRRPTPKIGLDIDGVLCDLYPTILARAGNLIGPEADGHMHHYEFRDSLNEALRSLTPEELLELPTLESGPDLPFEPVAYVTARYGHHAEAVEEWLAKNGFPYAPVLSTKDKVAAMKELGIDVYVDDKYEIFVDMQRAGITCFLMDAPYNRKYPVGNYRVHNLSEVARKLGLQ